MTLKTTRRRFLQKAAQGAGAIAALGGGPARARLRQPDRLSGLDDYVAMAITRWETPGLAIAIVKDGKPLVARGYGIRGLGATAAVDAETVFSIASCTKAFTAAAIARLVDHAKLEWDDPIARHLDSFQLSDPAIASQVTIRQALAHRTGLPTANMLWRSGAFSSDEILARLRWLQPVAAPGERFLYNNNLYLVAGKIVEQVAGRKWNDFLRSEFFEPLGMKSTAADSSEIRGLQNVAAPHASDFGKTQRIESYCPDVIAPAGAIQSNVLDMARWMLLHLEGGRSEGRQILSKTRLQEMHAASPRAEAQTPPKTGEPRAPIGDYGLGWFVNDYAGGKVVEHSGVQNGFVSWVAMLPEERLGLVILSNQHRTGLNFALRSWIFDIFLDRPARDWSEVVRTDYANGYQRLLREAKAQFDATRPPATRPPRPLSAYAGDYSSRLYGSVRIASNDGGLGLQFGSRFEGQCEHWQDDAFRVRFSNPRLDDWLISFAIDDRRVAGLRAKEAPWAPAWYDDADDLGEFRRD